MNDLTVWQFSRQNVEDLEFRDFLHHYGPSGLPRGSKFATMMGTMVFCIEGYDHDVREIHSIAEVRKFYRALHRCWPYWLENFIQ